MRIVRGLASFFVVLALAHAAGPTYSRIIPSLGSTSDTKIAAVAVDAAGNIYLTGSTEDQGFPSTPGVVQPRWGGGSCTFGGGSPFAPPPTFNCPDAFVVKLDAQGNVVFATYLGGGGFDEGTSIGVDSAGNIYVAGITTGFPVMAGSKFAGGATFIAKLNPTGTALLYTASIPGTGPGPFLAPFQANVPPSSVSMTMTVDPDGNAYFGAAGTPGFPVTAGALQQGGPLVVGKLNSTGSELIYATYFGGSALGRLGGIALDASRNAYLAGNTNSKDFPITAGALQRTLPDGASAAFVAKLNASGTGLIYGTYLGTSFDIATGVRVDGGGDAYVLGSASRSFPVTLGAFKTTYSTGDAFLAKLNPDATALVYATFLHTNGLPTTLFDIDPAGNAYFAGEAGSDFPATPNALQPCHAGGGGDAVVGQLTPAGKLAAATFLGGSSYEIVSGMAVTGDGAMFLAGVTNSPDFPVTQRSSFGPPGYFAVKLRIQGPDNPGTVCLSAGLQNAASFLEGPVAPGELVTLRGLRLGPETGAVAQADSTGQFTTSLAGTRVFFDGIAAPLLYAQSLQINAQVPWEVSATTATQVHVEFNGASTETTTVPIVPAAPAFFLGDYISHQGAILNQDGTLNSITNPAQRGSVVAIFGTGGGPTNPPSVTGASTPIGPFLLLTLPVSVTIDGKFDTELLYSGAAPTLISGVFQINFRIPDAVTPNSVHTVEIKVGGVASDPRAAVFIAVQ